MAKRLKGDLRELQDQLSHAEKKLTYYRQKITRLKRAIKYRTEKKLMGMLPKGEVRESKVDLSVFGVEFRED
jgi:hypothetical protein